MVDLKTPAANEGQAAPGNGKGASERATNENLFRKRLERLQVCLSKDILDRCWHIASVDRVTVASLVEEALSREIDRRENERGEPYPRRSSGRQGRRLVRQRRVSSS